MLLLACPARILAPPFPDTPKHGPDQFAPALCIPSMRHHLGPALLLFTSTLREMRRPHLLLVTGRDLALALGKMAQSHEAHTLPWLQTVPGLGQLLSLVLL
jgi:hypothetical protein